jgi:hypothetical protein
MIWALIVTVVGAYAALWGWITWRNRRRDAQKGKLRLLVEENGRPVWRIVKGQCVVGLTKWRELEVTAGYRRVPDGEEWVIIRSFKGKWIVYRPKGYLGDGQHRIGTLEIFDSLAELERAVPQEVFEEALKAAKLRPKKNRRLRSAYE